LRAFLAIPLPAEGAAALRSLQESLRTLSALEEFRWVAPRNIHLTLRFLGEIDEARARSAGEALGAAASRGSAFELSFERFGVFPHLRSPNVLWTGPSETPQALRALVEALFEELERAGFPREERPFRAHLTLARRRGRRRPPPGLEGELVAAEQRWLVPPPSFRVEEAVLFQSELRPGGAIYTPIRRHPLGEAI